MPQSSPAYYRIVNSCGHAFETSRRDLTERQVQRLKREAATELCGACWDKTEHPGHCAVCGAAGLVLRVTDGTSAAALCRAAQGCALCGHIGDDVGLQKQGSDFTDFAPILCCFDVEACTRREHAQAAAS